MIEARLQRREVEGPLTRSSGGGRRWGEADCTIAAFDDGSRSIRSFVDVGELVSNFQTADPNLGETIELSTVENGSSNLALIDVSQLQNTLLKLGAERARRDAERRPPYSRDFDDGSRP